MSHAKARFDRPSGKSMGELFWLDKGSALFMAHSPADPTKTASSPVMTFAARLFVAQLLRQRRPDALPVARLGKRTPALTRFEGLALNG